MDTLPGDVATQDTGHPDTGHSDTAPSDLGPDRTPQDAFAPLDGFGQINGQCGVLEEAVWNSSSPSLFRNAIDFGVSAFDPALLSAGGQTIYNAGNRGGSSLNSEIVAYEVLYRCELAKLLKTETQIAYQNPAGKKTDLLLEIDARVVGVSVTRAYHYPPDTPFTETEAQQLLDDKLADLPLSQSNAATEDAWSRSILHVLAYDAQHADAVQGAWSTLVDATIKGDAILLLTVTDGLDDFLY